VLFSGSVDGHCILWDDRFKPLQVCRASQCTCLPVNFSQGCWFRRLICSCTKLYVRHVANSSARACMIVIWCEELIMCKPL
jgi:hypothetical protein